MGFNDFVYFDPKPGGAEAHAEEVEASLKAKLAGKIQERLRTRISPGLNADQAARAGAIRAQAAAGSIIIDEDDQGKVLQRSTDQVSDGGGEGSFGKADAIDVNDLFKQSDGIPKIITRSDGTQTVAFRTINVSQLFGEQVDLRDQEVQKVVTDTLQGGMVESFEESLEEIERSHPTR